MKHLLYGAIFSIAALVSCKDEVASTTKPTTTVEETKPAIQVPTFNKDSAFQFIAKQVEFGPRVPNSKAHVACKDWLVSEFDRLTAKTYTQPFEANGYKGYNIIGSTNPAARRRIVIAAHWDSRHTADHDHDSAMHGKPVDGADDGGSGVGVILELARLLKAQPLQYIGIDFVLFDVEDQGESNGAETTWCLGSQHWSRNPHVQNYRAEYGILLDMVGGKNAQFPKEGFSMRYAPKIVDMVWEEARQLGYDGYFINEQFGGIIDDHKFVNEIAGIPMIDIIHVGSNPGKTFGAHWHTMNDNIDVIDKNVLNAVGHTLVSTLYKEDNK